MAGKGAIVCALAANGVALPAPRFQLGGSAADILVPTKVGSRVEMQRRPPTVDAHNLQKQSENLYVSQGLEEAERSLIIRVSMAAGSLSLRWAEE